MNRCLSEVEGLSLTVGALVQSLVGLGASAFNWSQGLGTPRRKGLAELVLSYSKPCSHIDPRLEDLCSDLSVELAKEKLDGTPTMPWDITSNPRDGRSPPRGAFQASSPQKSKFQVKGVVQGSLQAWKETDEGALQKTTQRMIASQLSRLKITIVHAQGLKNAGAAYCICEVPGKTGAKIQTPKIKSTQSPTWNHDFYCEHARGDSLRFAVRDSDSTRDDMLGAVIIQEKRFFPQGFHGELALEEGEGGFATAQLKIKIEVVDEAPEDEEPQPELSPMKGHNKDEALLHNDSEDYVWTQSGIDFLVAEDLFDEFGQPIVGSSVPLAMEEKAVEYGLAELKPPESIPPPSAQTVTPSEAHSQAGR